MTQEERLARIERKLDSISSSLDLVKVIAVVLLLLALAPYVLPPWLIVVSGQMLILLAGLGLLIYVGAWIMDRSLKRKLGSDEERFTRIMDELNQEPDTTEDQREDPSPQ